MDVYDSVHISSFDLSKEFPHVNILVRILQAYTDLMEAFSERNKVYGYFITACPFYLVALIENAKESRYCSFR